MRVMRGALSALAAVVMMAGCGAPDVPLKAGAAFSGGAFTISNNDDYAWASCDLVLNDDYKLAGVSVASQQVVKIDALDFTTGKGVRFNPITTKPMHLFIYCRSTVHGTRSSLVGWR